MTLRFRESHVYIVMIFIIISLLPSQKPHVLGQNSLVKLTKSIQKFPLTVQLILSEQPGKENKKNKNDSNDYTDTMTDGR